VNCDMEINFLKNILKLLFQEFNFGEMLRPEVIDELLLGLHKI